MKRRAAAAAKKKRQTNADLLPLLSFFQQSPGDDEPATTTATTNDRTEAAALARKKHGIRVKGSGANSSGGSGNNCDIPPPLDCFAPALRRAPEGPGGGVRSALERNLRQQGWLEPTPIQRQVVPLLSEGREVLAIAPTGSGKTLAFLLPIVVGCARARDKEQQKRRRKSGGQKTHKEGEESCYPRALVLSPTRELAAQTARVLSKLAEGTGVRGKMLTRGAAAAGAAFEGVDVLLATPLRLARALARKKQKNKKRKKSDSGGKKKRKGGSSSSSSDDEEEEQEHEDDDEHQNQPQDEQDLPDPASMRHR